MTTPRILYIDPFAGIAGDMLCAALIHLGVRLEDLQHHLRALPIQHDRYTLDTFPVTRGAFAATRFSVRPTPTLRPIQSAPAAAPAPRLPDSSHDHAHGHGHSHSHSHSHAGDEGVVGPEAWPGADDRTWRGIRAMLESAALPERARTRALAVFARLAEAEGRVHGVPAEDVHFHEVGALDSIVDIVAACVGLEILGVDRLVSGAPPLSAGEVRGAHGRIPLPAPATLEILRGWPVCEGAPGREEVTPTGAALLAALAEPGPFPAMVVEGVGYGAGKADPPDKANVVRAVLGRMQVADSPQTVAVIEAQMDDLSGEHLPLLLEALLVAGAVDAYATAVLMKKGRSGLLVTALATAETAPAVEEALLRHGSTFGVRRSVARRRVLARQHVVVQTPWGSVRVKQGLLNDEVLHAAPEHEDVRARAQAAGVPAPRVYAAAVAAWHTMATAQERKEAD